MSRFAVLLRSPIVLALLLAVGPAGETCGGGCCAARAATGPSSGAALSAPMPCCPGAVLGWPQALATVALAVPAPAVATPVPGPAGRPVAGADGAGRFYRPERSPRLVPADGLYTRHASFLI